MSERLHNRENGEAALLERHNSFVEEQKCSFEDYLKLIGSGAVTGIVMAIGLRMAQPELSLQDIATISSVPTVGAAMASALDAMRNFASKISA